MNCPYCNKANNMHSCINGSEKPKDGDISICIGCCKPVMYYNNATEQRKITDEEWSRLEEGTIDLIETTVFNCRSLNKLFSFNKSFKKHLGND